MDILNNHISVVELIQFSLTPVFLIVGIGQIINVVTGRLARIMDRARWYEQLKQNDVVFNEQQLEELDALAKRMKHANRAITFLTGAVVIVCLDVILLVANGIVAGSLDGFILSFFVLSMLAITAGLVNFFIEVSVANATLKITLD